MSDYHDYNENLAFPPHTILTPGGVIRVEGDWSDTQPKFHTDRTASTIELVGKIEKLSKQLDIAISGFAWIRNKNRFVDFGSKNKATVVLTTLAKDGYETAKQAVKEELEK